jgi:hypothetical protein
MAVASMSRLTVLAEIIRARPLMNSDEASLMLTGLGEAPAFAKSERTCFVSSLICRVELATPAWHYMPTR